LPPSRRDNRVDASARRFETPGRHDGLLIASLLSGAALVGLYLLETRVAEPHWLTTFLTYAPQQPFLLPSLLLFGIAAIRRHRRACLISALAVLFATFALLDMRLPKPSTRVSNSTLEVITWNVEHAQGGPEAVAALLRARRPDVICLQETNAVSAGPDPALAIAAALPGYHFARHGELLTASRLPILRTTVHPMGIPGSSRVALETTLARGGGVVTVWNLHFATASSASRRSGGTRFQRFIRHWADAGQTHLDQAETLHRWTRGDKGPVVLCGDLNTPPRGRAFARLTSRWTDAFDARGAGFGYTWNTRIPVLRIDHILTGGGASPLHARTLPTRASDHRALGATISLP
jgi:vancomycin resistance protein VanJ